MKKQILAMLLAILMFSAVGCSGTESETESADTTADAAETAASINPAEVDALPTDCRDYDGTEFVVMFRDRTEDSETWKTWDVYTEEQNGERINDAVFERNLAILDRFGVQVAEMQVRDRLNTAKSLILSGDSSFDLFQDIIENQGQLVIQGYVLNMSDMDYIDFSKAWWDSTVIEGISIGDNVYYSVGASQLNALKATWVVLFNKSLTTNVGITDLYQTVKDEKWTLDLLNQYSQQAMQDANGDGQMVWEDDVFGLGLQHEVVLPLLLGGGEKLIDIKEDGSYIYNMGNANVVDSMEKVHAFMNSGDHILNCQLARRNAEGSDDWEGFRGLFMSDQM
ncbi:MAG: hypothetical protein II979_00080, partial [Clostridia bacterium]|nr:hypothetical protein [Clostridia bacterium]